MSQSEWRLSEYPVVRSQRVVLLGIPVVRPAHSAGPIRTLVSHVNIVAADFVCLIVQGLGDVAKEVDQELQGLLHVVIRKPSITDSLCVVGDSGHNTPAGGAIAIIVHVAGGGRVVLSVHVMPRC